MAKRVYYEIDENGIAYLIMNDIEKKNIFSEPFVKELLNTIDELENKVKPKVAIVKGLAEVFCGGGDKETLIGLTEGQISLDDLTVSDKMLSVSFPTIAAMEGHAVGGGLVMGLCCDIILAARESRYGAVFMNMGFTPGMGCSMLLPELVGQFTAAEMMFTGKRFRGSELDKRGTAINYILPKDKIMKKAEDISLQIAEKNIKSLYLLKKSLSERKRELYLKARTHEDLMHTISFNFPETKSFINEFWAGD